MCEREKEMLYGYLLNYYNHLEAELKETRDRVFTSRASELDLLEYMICVIRLRAFGEFSKDLRTMLKL